ncbi:MAG TPA: R3H domain-containing nucleic acid-binding protein [Candidatus Saccharimonadales bacterium]|nr:R3H domain-containing nucleic acid-binding protein [Candidatus Saccharimonadales bacterium]
MNDDLLALAKLRLEEILTFFGVNTGVKAQFTGETIELSVDADVTGRLIGHRGETLAALQQLLNAIVRGQTSERVFVSIDIAGYKKARANHLTDKVQLDAKKVLETGEPKYLRPMNAAERRIIHMALADMPEVVTESEGEGMGRRVVIKKKTFDH